MEGNCWFESLTIYDVSHHVNSADSCPPGPVVPHTSCRNRCYEPYDGDVPGCRCDANCEETNSCCFDFNDTCTLPSKKRRVWMFHCDSPSVISLSWAWLLCTGEQWECTRLRCGEKRLEKSNCHCSDDCLSAGDCCTNYKHVCHGESVSTGHEDQIQTGCKYVYTLCITCRLFR